MCDLWSSGCEIVCSESSDNLAGANPMIESSASSGTTVYFGMAKLWSMRMMIVENVANNVEGGVRAISDDQFSRQASLLKLKYEFCPRCANALAINSQLKKFDTLPNLNSTN